MRRCGLFLTLLPGVVLAPPLHAQTVAAHRGADGLPWCSGSGVTLTQLASGGFEASMRLLVEEEGPQTTNLPGSGVNFHGAPAVYHASITVFYKLAISAAGQPDMPLPYRIEVSSPGHVGPIPPPIAAYRLQIMAGTIRSPVLNDTYVAESSTLQLFATIAPQGQANPKQTALAFPEMAKLVREIEGKGVTVLVLRGGKEVARTTLPGTGIPAQSRRMLEWLGQAIPLLKQGKCSA